jgi:predicted ATP-dependent endonuclease of OLD family
MILDSIRVQNYRCILDEKLTFEELTVLVGPNGSGKSSFLSALDLFYNPKGISKQDFYNEDTTNPIILTAMYKNLTQLEQETFKQYINNHKLKIREEINISDQKTIQKYFGKILKNSEFNDFRKASGQNLKTEYEKLRQNGYGSLPEYTNKDQAEIVLQEWEKSNPEKCNSEKDDGNFFGFYQIGRIHLERFTKMIFIPAVRDASADASEGRGAAITELLDLVIREYLHQNEDLKKFEEKTKEEYEKIINSSQCSQLKNLEKDLCDALNTYIPDSEIKVTWNFSNGIQINMPRGNIQIVEDTYCSTVDRSGHGVQRAFIMTMLQHLTIIKSKAEVKEEDEKSHFPSLLIAIEEPELYQHPNRQRHLSKTLLKLSKNPLSYLNSSIQIVYTTHSPLFLDIIRFSNIRKLHKFLKVQHLPKTPKIYYTTLDEVARSLERLEGVEEGTFSESTLQSRLITCMTPWMNEGFFADVVVLVEGEGDRAALIGAANAMNIDFESVGISVIPCGGKTNLHKPAVIFRQLGIPIYILWDSDSNKPDSNPENNHRLLRLFDQECEDYPEMITDKFSCFKDNLEITLQSEVGDDFYNQTLAFLQNEYDIKKKKDAKKNPKIIQRLFKMAEEDSRSSKKFEKIVQKIIKLKDEE